MSRPDFDVERLCRDMAAARAEVVKVLRAIPRDRWRTKGPGGNWSPAIIAAHLVASDWSGLRWVASGGGGPLARLPRKMVVLGNELWNRLTALRSRNTDLRAAAGKLERFEPRLLAFTRGLSPAKLSRPIVSPADGSASPAYQNLRSLYVDHLRDHAEELRLFLPAGDR